MGTFHRTVLTRASNSRHSLRFSPTFSPTCCTTLHSLPLTSSFTPPLLFSPPPLSHYTWSHLAACFKSNIHVPFLLLLQVCSFTLVSLLMFLYSFCFTQAPQLLLFHSFSFILVPLLLLSFTPVPSPHVPLLLLLYSCSFALFPLLLLPYPAPLLPLLYSC